MTLQDSWSAFSKESAETYLTGRGSSADSKRILTEILKKEPRPLSILDIGCGNAQLYGYFKEHDLACTYSGVDFSDPLLEAGQRAYPEITLLSDDVHTLAQVTGHYDVALYSHVIEMLESPEESLFHAKRLADKILIRFFEPPHFEFDRIEIKTMDEGRGPVPYLRRKMGKSYYEEILKRLGMTAKVYTSNAKDEIHVLTY